MKELILNHGQSILTEKQKAHILKTGKLPEANIFNYFAAFPEDFINSKNENELS